MRCPACDTPNPPEVPCCTNCGEVLPPLPQGQQGTDAEENGENNHTILPYRNPRAYWAYFCALGGLIPGAGLILGPVAMILGALGLRYVRVNPRVKGRPHAIAGMVMGGFEILFNGAGLICLLIWLRVL